MKTTLALFAALTLSAHAAITLPTVEGAVTYGQGTDATHTWTFNLSTGTDPVITISNGVINVSTGALQVGGVAVGAIAVTGSVAAGTVDASGFNGNLTTSDNTMQEIAQKLDDLSVGASDFDALTAATEADIATSDVFAVSDGGTEKKITLENMVDLLEAQTWTFADMTVTTLTAGTMLFEGATADAYETTLAVTDPTADRTWTIPDATDTAVGKATTDTLTNKTLTAPAVSGTVTGTFTLPTTATAASSPSAADSDTSLATTAFVQGEVDGTQTGVHATPSTTNPLAPTWTGPMHTVWYGATGEIDLPAASGYVGRGILVYNTGAFTVSVDPNGSEIIVRDGTAQTGGVTMTLSSGAGNFVALISDGSRWITLGYKGTLGAGS